MKVVILGYSGLIGNSILENLAKNNSYIYFVLEEMLNINLLEIQELSISNGILLHLKNQIYFF